LAHRIESILQAFAKYFNERSYTNE